MAEGNILLVDDRPENLLALEAVLDDSGYNLVKASSGEEALGHLLNQEFAVILLDARMPGMDGFETAQLIRGREKSHDIPIIFITAEFQGLEHMSQAYALKAVDYMLKPFDPEILRTKVAVLVELYRKASQARRQAEELEQIRQRQEREIQSLERLIAPSSTASTAQAYGLTPLREGLPSTYEALVQHYGELMNLALEERGYRVEHQVSSKLRAIARQMGTLRAGPRDVVEIHSVALKDRMVGTTLQKANAYIAEGRLMVLELMGHLVSFYRSYYSRGVGRRSSADASHDRPGGTTRGETKREPGKERDR